MHQIPVVPDNTLPLETSLAPGEPSRSGGRKPQVNHGVINEAGGSRTDSTTYKVRNILQTTQFHSDSEIEAVVCAFERQLVDPETPSFLLVTGPLGSGRASLVKHALNKRIKDQKGYYLRAKHDFLCRPVPYRGLVAAFAEFAHQVVTHGPDAIQKMKDAIGTAVGGGDCHVLTRVFSPLKQIIGDQHEQEESSKSNEPRQRFVLAFLSLIRAISSLDHPLVLVLDNMQWADADSVDLVSLLVTESIEGLVLVGTMDDSVSDCSFAQKLIAWKEDGVASIETISMKPLELDQIYFTLEHDFHVTLDQTESLGDILFHQSKGILFNFVELLQWLQDQKLFIHSRETDMWQFDVQQIHSALKKCPKGSFLKEKLDRLPSDLREVLKVSACLGYQLDPTLIESVVDYPVTLLLAKAKSMHLLSVDRALGLYSFAHDWIMQASYEQIPGDGRELFHLEIGRRLRRSWKTEDIDEAGICVFLSQVCVGKRLVTREKERYTIATLSLQAGRTAAQLSAFRLAALYLNLGIELLGTRAWRDEYALTLALHDAAAEMNMCAGNFDAIESLIESVLKNSRSADDRIQAQATKIYAMGLNDRQNDGVMYGIGVLSHLGVRFPRIKSKRAVKSELQSVYRLLRGMTNDHILNLPIIEDETVLATMQILSAVRALLCFCCGELDIGRAILRRLLCRNLSRCTCIAFCSAETSFHSLCSE
jgi:predicted ATPase